jgi:hypothetical protein
MNSHTYDRQSRLSIGSPLRKPACTETRLNPSNDHSRKLRILSPLPLEVWRAGTGAVKEREIRVPEAKLDKLDGRTYACGQYFESFHFESYAGGVILRFAAKLDAGEMHS